MKATGTRPPYGRAPVFEYVKDALRRKGTPRVPVPALLLIGPRGSGGTAVLDRLWGDHRNCPGAKVSGVRDETVASVLGRAMLAFGERRGPGVRTVDDFPHMILAAKTLRYQGDPYDVQAFIAYLQKPIDTAELTALIKIFLPKVPGVPDTGVLAEPVKRLISAYRRHETARLAKNLGDFQNLLDAAALYQAALEAKAKTPVKCDRLLVEAFLADLRADSNRWGPLQRHTNLLLLLDDCDGESGDRLVDLIADCRRAAHKAGSDPDPLVAVFVRHARRPTERRPAIAADDNVALRYVQLPANASLPQHPDLQRLVTLTALGFDDVQDMVQTMETGSNRQDTELVLALSGGHPAAAQQLAGLLAELQEAALGPPGLFAAPWPPGTESEPDQQPSETVLDHLLSRLLDAEPGRLDRFAVLASTSRGFDDAACTSVYSYLQWSDIVADDEKWLRTRLWFEGRDGADGPLHPLITRLLRQLMARNPGRWTAVHENFARHYVRVGGEGSQDARWWHTMATVVGPDDAALAELVTLLEKEIQQRPIEEFRRRVDWIATAPSRLAPASNAELELNRIAGPQDRGDRRREVTRRLVGRWLQGSVYLDPRGELADIVAADDAYLVRFGKGSQ